MTDLSTRYMNLELSCPIIVSACPLSRSLDSIKKMEDAGAGAVVLYSLFEEQVSRDRAAVARALDLAGNAPAEAARYLPPIARPVGPDQYLSHIVAAKQAVDIPIIASLNGCTFQGWANYARQIEQAGADAVELNLYRVAADPDQPAVNIESQYLDTLKTVKRAVNIPIALKLSPFFTSFANIAIRFDAAGADSLVLFNRFYQPDIDLSRLSVDRNLAPSTPDEIRLPLLWIGMLRDMIICSLAGGRGVETAEQVMKYLLVGADAVMVAGSLLRHGVDQVRVLRESLEELILDYGHESVRSLQGLLSRSASATPGDFERANYLEVLEELSTPDADQ
jgi:dihydroorotate dehydrogenase (fumarate)